MFNSFPTPKPDSGGGQWVHDWSAHQPVYDLSGATVSVPASNWQTFVNVTGKGFLKWCRLNTTTAPSANPAIRITVDGKEYIFNSPLAGQIYQGNEVNIEIPFKVSLKIEGFNRDTSAASMLCDYLYLLQQSTPNPNKSTLLLQSQRNMGYLNTTAITLTDVINITGSGYLLGIRFLGYYSTVIGSIYGDLTVDGTLKMNNRPVLTLSNENYKQTEWGGPIRFNSSLRVRTSTDNAGSSAICMAWYSLD